MVLFSQIKQIYSRQFLIQFRLYIQLQKIIYSLPAILNSLNSLIFKMTNIFKQEAAFIDQIETHVQSLTPQKVELLINKQYFYQAKHELAPLITLPPQQLDKILANKILEQLTHHTDKQQIISKVQHRLNIICSDEFHQQYNCKSLFSQQKQQIHKSDVKIKDFLPLYREQVQAASSLDNPLTRKTIEYFQSIPKDKRLDEVLTDLIDLLEQPALPSSNLPRGQYIDEQTRAQLDHIVQELGLVQRIFHFQ